MSGSIIFRNSADTTNNGALRGYTSSSANPNRGIILEALVGDLILYAPTAGKAIYTAAEHFQIARGRLNVYEEAAGSRGVVVTTKESQRGNSTTDPLIYFAENIDNLNASSTIRMGRYGVACFAATIYNNGWRLLSASGSVTGNYASVSFHYT
jgi:hypothetical protein